MKRSDDKYINSNSKHKQSASFRRPGHGEPTPEVRYSPDHHQQQRQQQQQQQPAGYPEQQQPLPPRLRHRHRPGRVPEAALGRDGGEDDDDHILDDADDNDDDDEGDPDRALHLHLRHRPHLQHRPDLHHPRSVLSILCQTSYFKVFHFLSLLLSCFQLHTIYNEIQIRSLDRDDVAAAVLLLIPEVYVNLMS